MSTETAAFRALRVEYFKQQSSCGRYMDRCDRVEAVYTVRKLPLAFRAVPRRRVGPKAAARNDKFTWVGIRLGPYFWTPVPRFLFPF